MLSYFKIVVAILGLCYIPSIYCLIRNYKIAKRIGLPIFVTPIDKFNPFSQIFLNKLVFPLLAKAPLRFLRDWALFGDFGWPVPDRGRIHERWGTAFVVVTPGNCTVVTDDPKATEDVLRRTNAFIKPPLIYSNIEYFGPNVDTVNHDAWARHRRLTTPPFNERNSGLVWKESLRQAKGMIAKWTGDGVIGAVETSSDTMKLALHVLTSAGFGKSYEFSTGTGEIAPGHKMSYKDSLAGILGDMLTAILAWKINAPSWMLSKNILRMKECMAEFKQYMVESVEEQRSAMDLKQNMQQDNLMSALVRANEISRDEGKERYSLSDEEIYGNLFIWNLAGHDTTATTLAFTFTVLSAYPDVQEWIAEEVKEVFGDSPADEWDYESAFPKLKRCLATMYETLRLYGPVPSMAKQTETPQPLEIAGKDYTIPANFHITLNLYSLHLNKKYWGNDVDLFRPSRFIDSNGDLSIPSPAGTFLPWVNGPRVCPGKKFAQVEFVSTLAVCLRRHRVATIAEAGETKELTRRRVLAVAQDSEMGVNPVVKMIHPEKVAFRWSEVQM